MANLSIIFEQLHTDLAECLIACRTDPDTRTVHSVRTTARRIEALLRKVVDDHPRAVRLRGKIEKALHQLKKIRRAAGPVRDLDVQRELMMEITEASRIVESVKQRKEVSSESKGLDYRLHRQRKQLAANLTKTLKDAEPALERALDRVPDAMGNMSEISALKTVKRMVMDNQLDLNGVNGESLHLYRKRTKVARYLAEMEKTSSAAQRLANRLKKVLDDIGRWHDLMLLSEESKAVLGKQSMLTQAIRAERNRALKIAIHSTGTIYPSR
jgi:CHAD domain-containing protein